MSFHLDYLLDLPGVTVETCSCIENQMRKGHENFVTVVGDIEQGNLLEVIDSHRSEEIIAALQQQSLEIRSQVEEVSIDMWGGFPKVNCP